MKTPYVNLKNIDTSLIDQKYNFIVYREKNKNEHKKKTKISEINKNNKNSYFSYIDEAKKDHICSLTMRDNLRNESLPVQTEIHCFWCRHSFKFRPLGCPINYKSSRLFKKYYSEITKNNYVLEETITLKQLEDSKSTKDENYFSLEFEPRNHYITDGIFCSFNCCYAFIEDNKTNTMYNQSESLLKKMYYDLFPDYEIKLIKSPHWRLLKEYGGDLTIDDFRKNFYKVEYINNNDYMTTFPTCKTIGILFEKKIKL
jgi:hypothetical protein